MSRLRALTSRCVAKSACGGLVDDLSLKSSAAGHHDPQTVAELYAVRLRLRQRCIDPRLRQVHDAHNRFSHGDHFALPRRPYCYAPVTGETTSA